MSSPFSVAFPFSSRNILDGSFEFLVQCHCHSVDFRILKLSEQGRRKVVLDHALIRTVFSNINTKWRIKAGPNISLSHLKGDERVSNDVLFSPSSLARQAQEQAMIDRIENHQPERTFNSFYIIPYRRFRLHLRELLVKGGVVDTAHARFKS